MSANTRYGFDPADAISAPPKPAEEQRGARTVFGRDFHLPDLTKKPEPDPAPAPRGATPAPPATAPRAQASEPAFAVTIASSIGDLSAVAVRAPAAARTPAVTPIKNSLSVPAPEDDPRRPTATPTPKNREHMARFLARRNTVGDIVPLTQKDSLFIPRERWVKPALTVGGAALCSFVVVALVMWIASARRDKPAPAGSEVAKPTTTLAAPRSVVAAVPAKSNPAAAPPSARPAAAVAPNPVVPTLAPATALTPPAVAVKVPASVPPPTAKAAATSAKTKFTPPRKPRPRKPRVGPDDPLPPTFF